MSILQHYGLKTALLDITKNPYIAMLFMICDNKQKINEPTLYLFRINDRIDSKSTLFTEVKKSHINKQIDAQKGAFLNYEKMLDFNGKYKMPYVKIVLKFDIDEYNKIIEEGKINLHYINLETTELRNKAGQNDKEKYDDLKTLIMSPKLFIQDSFNGLNYELKLKLKEYSYTIEDMFPDFESRLRYVSNKYRDGNKKSIYDKNYRTFSNN